MHIHWSGFETRVPRFWNYLEGGLAAEYAVDIHSCDITRCSLPRLCIHLLSTTMLVHPPSRICRE
jgi:hypothetical protein